MRELLANFHFLRPAWLLLAPAAIGLWWLWQRQLDPLRGWRAQIDHELLQALAVDEGTSPATASHWLLVGWLSAVVAVAGPTWRLEPNPFAEDAEPLMIVLKADTSMDRPDPPPSRMARAQLKIADLAELRKGQPLGLIVYAGSPHLVLPPTRDTAVVAEMAAEVSPAVMPVAGDRLDLALRKATKILAEGALGGSLLVIADSVAGAPRALATDHTGSQLPLQFLALSDPDSAENDSVHEAAQVLGATVRQLSVDDADVKTISQAATHSFIAGVGGDRDRWQEAGYWLLPWIALLVAVSFRRVTLATMES